MDGFIWAALLLWTTMIFVQDKILMARLGLEWGWWTLANSFALLVGLFVASIVAFSVLFSFQLDLLKTRDLALIFGIFAILLGASIALIQSIVLKRQRVPKSVVWSSINIIVAIVAYILLASFNSTALWKGDWKPIIVSVFVGAIIGAATAIATDLYCLRVQRLAHQQDEDSTDWEEDEE
ncbi:MAG: hypothetical protein KME32_34305 [Mojavia pulchra JT2-VF2]|jgi:hypothetical protein|uniref:Uncharacterized protein n=1 Tax=Mojavia pulchra JT2-VF2 TaxID=287848 RepID=A0A951Q7M2_9NOST|nr:hypothetical protein [Mojavia pulchra JT2-VF2]